MTRSGTTRFVPSSVTTVLICAALVFPAGCGKTDTSPRYRTFASPEDAARALIDEVKKQNLSAVVAIFGPEGQELVDSSDPVTARRNQQTFTAAVGEQWRLEERGPDSRTLVIGNENWPFPIPLVKEGNAWRFDTAAGKEEVIARRIGHNELAAIRLCLTYVAAQRIYARTGHDGERAGLYAAKLRSDPGKHNGLYWQAARGEKRSPIGDLVANAAKEGAVARANGDQPAPFHGYYFRILTAQGPAAPGGAKDYFVDGKLSRGFALIAWPARYDVTGVMTFVVNDLGIVHEKDLGADTETAARSISAYDPDASWASVQ
jgi:hypothetical protein